MSFGKAEATALFNAMVSHALSLGVFARVNQHEPANAPGLRLSCSITLGTPGIRSAPDKSGQAAVSVIITFTIKIWSSLNQKPLDGIDPEVLGVVSLLLNEYASHFTLGGTVRDIDALALTAAPGYLQAEGTEYRVVDVTVPVVIDDAWVIAP